MLIYANTEIGKQILLQIPMDTLMPIMVTHGGILIITETLPQTTVLLVTLDYLIGLPVG